MESCGYQLSVLFANPPIARRGVLYLFAGQHSPWIWDWSGFQARVFFGLRNRGSIGQAYSAISLGDVWWYCPFRYTRLPVTAAGKGCTMQCYKEKHVCASVCSIHSYIDCKISEQRVPWSANSLVLWCSQNQAFVCTRVLYWRLRPSAKALQCGNSCQKQRPSTKPFNLWYAVNVPQLTPPQRIRVSSLYCETTSLFHHPCQ